MSYLIYVSLFILFCIWFYYVLRCHNPWKFYLYTGKKGSGKSTFEAYIASRFKNRRVLVYERDRPRFHRFHFVKLKIYSNSPFNGIDFEMFNPVDLGVSFFPEPYSVLFCDEISLYWWNRNFKSMDSRTVEWFRNQRKYKCIVYGFTQSWDIDKVLRKSLVDNVYLIKNLLVTWSYARRVEKYQDIKDSALDCDSQFAESMRFAPIWLPNALKIIWIPKYWKYFDTNYIFKKDG